MASPLLQNSPSLKSIDQAIDDSKVIRQHLEDVNNRYVSLITELMDESDPKTLLQKSVSARLKLISDLEKRNGELYQKNALLEKELKKLKSENKTLKTFLSQNQQIQNHTLAEMEPSQSESSDSAQKSDPQFLLSIGTEKQSQAMNLVEQNLENARIQSEKVGQNWQKVIIFMEDVFERLNRMVDFQKIGKNEVYDEEKLTITISKQKYDLLFDFYTQSRPVASLPQKVQQSNGNQVNQFDAEEQSDQMVAGKVNIDDLTVDDLEKIFRVLAEKNGLTDEWNHYLKNRQSENQKQLTKLKEIASGKSDQQNQSKIDQSISSIKFNQSLLTKNTEASEITTSKIQFEEKEIEPCLFNKIRELMKNLNFSQTEFDIFNRFDKKRQYGRLYDLDELLCKFKDKTDLSEISEEYTKILIKTINSLLVSIMSVLTESSPQNPQNLSWFNKKLDQKYSDMKSGIFQVIQEQCSQYLEDKRHGNSENTVKQSKIVPIIRPKFDKEKQLEKKIVRVISEYKALMRKSVFSSSKEIRLIL